MDCSHNKTIHQPVLAMIPSKSCNGLIGPEIRMHAVLLGLAPYYHDITIGLVSDIASHRDRQGHALGLRDLANSHLL